MNEKHLLEQLQANATYIADLGEALLAGWGVRIPVTQPTGAPGGPTIYLCHYEAQYLFLTQLVSRGIEKVQVAAESRVSSRDAGDTLGVIMEELAMGKRTLTDRVRSMLAAASALYLAGTQTYRVAVERGMNQLLVISYYNVGENTRTLRPTATDHPGPLTPDQVSEVVLETLANDRRNHPERFHQNVPLRFRATAL